MQGTISRDEFIRRAVGLPWARWRSDWSAADCFGLIVLWHREVLGVDLGAVPRTDIAEGFAAATGWIACDAEEGATCFMAWRGSAPTHCGVLLPHRRVLHSDGAEDRPGSVRVSPLSAMQRVYGDIRFYRHAPC